MVMAPPEQYATILNLLKASSLDHLFSTLNEKTSLSEMQSKLASNRPLLLNHLKDLGVEKLGERQALANALSKAEKEGRLPSVRPIAHLQVPIFEELDDATITVRLKVPAEVQSNQLKMHSDANSLRVELRGEPTALTGKLYALVKPRETIWELERSKRPEYDPMLDATEQPLPDDDTMCITLYKAEPGRWPTLFSDGVAKRYVPPPPPPKVESEKDKEVKKALEVRKREMLYGMTFKQRPMDLDHKKHMEREARREYEKSRDRKAKETPQWSAHEHWPSATAILLMRDGRKEAKGCPDHPEDSGPMYSWVEDRSKLVVRASTRKGLEQSSLKLHATKTSVECEINGVATPWCGHLVGRIDPDSSKFEVIRDPTEEASDILQLTLIKAVPNSLWRAPWPELIAQIDVKEKKALVRKPQRHELLVGGFDQGQKEDKFEIVIQFKAGFEEYLAHDDFRIGVTDNALNIHIAGQEDMPILGGQLRGKIDPRQCSWRVRKGKKKGSMLIEELVIELHKESGQGYWKDLFKTTYS